jgi:hypothetical protein
MMFVALAAGLVVARALLHALDQAEEMGQPAIDWL